MKRFLIVTSVLAVSGLIGLRIYRRKLMTTPDKLTMKLEDIDYNKKQVKYAVFRDGKFDMGGQEFWRDDLANGVERAHAGSQKNTHYVTMTKDGKMILRGTSLGLEQYKKVIDFKNKKAE